MMRVPLFALSVAAAAVLAAQPSSAAPSATCGVLKAKVVVANKEVQVVGRGTQYWACLRGHTTRLTLNPSGDVAFRLFRVMGRFAAFEQSGGCFAPCWRVVSLDVRSGRRLTSYTAFRDHPLRHLVLDARGRVAWVRDEAERELHRMDHDGEEVLDRGAGIVPSSLVIRKSRVRWVNQGTKHSAPLDTHPPCAAPNSTTLTRNAVARVYWRIGRVVGCHIESGRRTFLGNRFLDNFEYYGGGAVALGGVFASIDEGYSGRGGATADLYLTNLETGAVVRRWKCCFQEGDFGVRSVVVSPTGAMAWTNSRRARSLTGMQVRKSDADGEAILLDADENYNAIDPASLRLNGNTLTWTHSGETRSADLH